MGNENRNPTLSEAQAHALLSVSGWTEGRTQQPLETALQALIDAECFRKGQPEPKTGAFHVLALTQGSLLKEEYDVSTHGHLPAWEIGVLVVDVKEMIRLNQEVGFALGDEVFREVVRTLKALHPQAKLVHLHADAFACLLAPTSGEKISLEAKTQAEVRLRETTRALLQQRAVSAYPVDFTVSAVRLEISQPSHWQVLGPLVWAESERAHVLERRGEGGGVQHRYLGLGGTIS